jgi:hypothetical protein
MFNNYCTAAEHAGRDADDAGTAAAYAAGDWSDGEWAPCPPAGVGEPGSPKQNINSKQPKQAKGRATKRVTARATLKKSARPPAKRRAVKSSAKHK